MSTCHSERGGRILQVDFPFFSEANATVFLFYSDHQGGRLAISNILGFSAYLTLFRGLVSKCSYPHISLYRVVCSNDLSFPEGRKRLGGTELSTLRIGDGQECPYYGEETDRNVRATDRRRTGMSVLRR